MAKILLKLGASSSQADLNGCTAFHRYVEHGESGMIDTLWELDKTGVKAALNHVLIGTRYWNPPAISPLHTAIANNDTILVMKLLEAGASPQIDFESWLKAAKFSKNLEKRLSSFEENMKMYSDSLEQPLIVALRTCPDPKVAYELLRAGADPNSMTPISYRVIADQWTRNHNQGETSLDIVRQHITNLRDYTGEKCTAVKPVLPEDMHKYLEQFDKGSYRHWLVSYDIKGLEISHKWQLKTYEEQLDKFKAQQGVAEKEEVIRETLVDMERVEQLIVKMGGKTFKELHPDIQCSNQNNSRASNAKVDTSKAAYEFKFLYTNTTDVTETRKQAYHDL
jgi:hypothetical protein